MEMFDLLRKPSHCPYCGGKIYKILYGEPMYSEAEYLARFHEHVIFGGCLISDQSPDYECSECHLQFRVLHFPSNVKELAIKRLKKQPSDIFQDVQYEGIYDRRMVFSPITSPGICWDGLLLVLVSQHGKTRIMDGSKVIDVLSDINQENERWKNPPEEFYQKAAKRYASTLEYYDDAYYLGLYKGKRAYQPGFDIEYIVSPPIIGVYPLILVNSKGVAESINFLNCKIYTDIKRRMKRRLKKNEQKK